MDIDMPAERGAEGLEYFWFSCPMNAIHMLPSNITFSQLRSLENGTDHLPDDMTRFHGTGPVVTVVTASLGYDNIPASYTFRLFVAKPGFQPAASDQQVQLVPGDPPNVDIACFMNCDEYVNPSEKLVFKAVCTSCRTNDRLLYKWHLLAREGNFLQEINWDTDTTTGRFSYNLAIKANVFSVIRQDTYDVVLNVSTQDSAEGSFTYTFTTNAIPTPGSCDIQPSEGFILQTRFNMSCVDFVDDNVPLLYQIWVSFGENSTDRMIHYGLENEVTGLLLPSGDTNNNYSLVVTVAVVDTFGAASRVSQSVTVKPPMNLSTKDLMDLTSGSDSVLGQILYTKDPQATTQVIMSISSVMHHNAVEEDLSQKAEHIQIRERLIEGLGQVEPQSVTSLLQLSAALDEVTAVPTELSSSAQTQSVEQLTRLSHSLLMESSDQSGSVDIQGCGKFLLSTVSNMLESVSVLTDASENDTGILNTINGVPDPSSNKTEVRNLTKSSLLAFAEIKSGLLPTIVPGEAPTNILTKCMSLHLTKFKAHEVEGLEMNVKTVDTSWPDSTTFSLPRMLNIDEGVEEISSEITQFKDNPYSWSDTSSRITTSVTEILLSGKNNSKLSPLADNQPISILVPYNGGKTANEDPPQITLDGNSTGVIEMILRLKKSGILTSVKVGVTGNNASEDMNLDLDKRDGQIVLKIGYIPGNDTVSANNDGDKEVHTTRLKRSIETWTDEVWQLSDNRTLNFSNIDIVHQDTVTLSDLDPESAWMMQLSKEQLRGSGEYILLIYTDNTTVTVNVSLVTMETGCTRWDEDKEEWSDEDCTVGPSTKFGYLNCECKELGSFGAGFFVMPNKLNFKEDLAKFLEFWNNPVGIIAVATAFVVYVFAVMWARRKDAIYNFKRQPIDLMDNDPTDGYVYILTVFTGSRQGSGTTSDVTVTLTGERGQSRPHVLDCGDYSILQRTDINFFLIRTSRSLGDMKALRFWHHNSGRKPSWYLSRAVVQDPQLGRVYQFLCNSWLAVDIGEGTLDKTFPAATEQETKQFETLFKIKTDSGFNDRHMWFSSVRRHAYSSFTCVQRVSCCLSLFLSYMLCNIMFYGINPAPGEQELDLGPFAITWTELRIGFQTSLFMFPINLLIVTLFRNVKPRKAAQPKCSVNTSSKEAILSDIAVNVKCADINSDTSMAVIKDRLDQAAKSIIASEYSNSMVMLHQQIFGSKVHNASGNSCAGNSISQNRSSRHSLLHRMEQSLTNNQNATFPLWGIRQSAQWLVGLIHNKQREHDQSISRSDEPDSNDEPQSAFEYTTSRNQMPQGHSASRRKESQGPHSGVWIEDIKLQEMRNCTETVTVEPEVELFPDSAPGPRGGRCGCCLPWWFVYLAWFLVVGVSASCGFFTILYTFNYGLELSLQWLKALLISFVSDLFVAQPFKVLAMALVVSLILRTPEEVHLIQLDHLPNRTTDQSASQVAIAIQQWLRKDPRYNPPAQELLTSAKDTKEVELHMRGIAVEIVRYLFFLYLVLLIAYAQRDSTVYSQNSTLKDMLFDGDTFDEISKLDDVYDWLKDSVLDAMYDERYPKFMSNGVTFRLGSPKIRQIRMKKLRGCNFAQYSDLLPCHWTYVQVTEDTSDHNGSWTNDESITNGQYHSIWNYKTSHEAGGTQWNGQFGAYSGGGYVVELGATRQQASDILDHLADTMWLDGGTAAVTVDLATYSANINLLTTISLQLEISPIGRIWKTADFYSMKMYQSTTGVHYFVLAVQILYCIYTFTFFAYEVNRMKKLKWKYFKNMWNFLEISTILVSFSTIGIHIAQVVEMNNALSDFSIHETKLKMFRTAEILDQSLYYSFGLLVFIAMVKFLHLLRFNPLIHMFGCVLQKVMAPFLGFLIFTFVFLAAFGGMVHVMMGHAVDMFRNMAHTQVALLLCLLGSYDDQEVREFHHFWGPLLLTFYLCMVIFVFFNLFLKVLFVALEEVKACPQPSEDAELLWLLLDRIRQWFGIRQKSRSD